jgi:hypothetical protein
MSDPGVPVALRLDAPRRLILGGGDVGPIDDRQAAHRLPGGERPNKLTVDRRQVVEAERRRFARSGRTSQGDDDRRTESNMGKPVGRLAVGFGGALTGQFELLPQEEQRGGPFGRSEHVSRFVDAEAGLGARGRGGAGHERHETE